MSRNEYGLEFGKLIRRNEYGGYDEYFEQDVLYFDTEEDAKRKFEEEKNNLEKGYYIALTKLNIVNDYDTIETYTFFDLEKDKYHNRHFNVSVDKDVLTITILKKNEEDVVYTITISELSKMDCVWELLEDLDDFLTFRFSNSWFELQENLDQDEEDELLCKLKQLNIFNLN